MALWPNVFLRVAFGSRWTNECTGIEVGWRVLN